MQITGRIFFAVAEQINFRHSFCGLDLLVLLHHGKRTYMIYRMNFERLLIID